MDLIERFPMVATLCFPEVLGSCMHPLALEPPFNEQLILGYVSPDRAMPESKELTPRLILLEGALTTLVEVDTSSLRTPAPAVGTRWPQKQCSWKALVLPNQT